MSDARAVFTDDVAGQFRLSDGAVDQALLSEPLRSKDHSVTIREITVPEPGWDAFVAQHPFGDIVQSSLWALTKRALGHTPVLVTLTDSNGVIVGGLLAIEQRFKGLLRFAIVSKGPIARNNDNEVLKATIDALVANMLRRGLFAVFVQPSEGAEAFEPCLEERGFLRGIPAVGTEATARVDLMHSEEEILAGFSSSGRRHVRKSLAQGIIVERSEDVADFHRLYSASAARKGFRPVSLEYLQSQWQVLSPGGHVAIMVAKYRNEVHAAIWLTVFGGTVTYKFPGWAPSRESPKFLNEFLHWETLRWARRNGARYYDFGGFNRQAAENIANGMPLPSGFESTHHLFKYGFDPHPAIFPKAQFLIGSKHINRFAGPLFRAALNSKVASRLAQRLRG